MKVCIFCLGALACLAQAQQQQPVRCSAPLTEEQLTALVRGRVSPERIRRFVEQCGVSFVLTEQASGRLRQAGATETVLGLVRDKSKKLQADSEQAAWEVIGSVPTIESLEGFLAKHPAGEHAEEARAKVRELTALPVLNALRVTLDNKRWSDAEQRLRELQRLTGESEQTRAFARQIEDGLEAEREADRRREEEKRPWGPEMKWEFVRIEPGSFMMGCAAKDKRQCLPRETPLHRVEITKGFEIGKYEVTQAQWQAVMRNNPSAYRIGPDLAVEHVSWNDVQEFLVKVNARKDGYRYRLPTEAEWEYAARAGGAEGLDRVNGWGLYDMRGNVFEWCSDWYGDYESGNAVDPKGPSSGQYRVQRGGSWAAAIPFVRVSYRGFGEPGNPNLSAGSIGFRCVREVDR